MKVLASILLYLFSVGVYADKNKIIALVTFVNGEAYYQEESKMENLKVHTLLQPGSSVFTKKGQLRIQLGKNSILHLPSYSKLSLEYSGTEEKFDITLLLKEGALYTRILKDLEKKSNFKVLTKTYVAGVRGTEFLIQDYPSSVGAEKNGVFVHSGKVEIRDASSDIVRDTLQAGEELIQDKDKMVKKLLDDYMVEKLRIFEELKVMKEKTYELLKEQKLKNLSIYKSSKEKMKK
ncbi:MAG: FecR domain-containing protein [Leptospiraceae bacterium]|nr:FecR domain-containing protein [Leptospiraceae bacterium]MCP5502933.1 FecR domain-containing protein [Leptospiraceae bacterium]